MGQTSLMLQETGEAGDAVARLLAREGEAIAALAARVRALAPAVITTAARGSSDHAATYFKYVFEILTGIPVASIGPSIASVYQTPLKLRNGVHVTVSQSGASPDIVALQAAARAGGALTVAFVNVADSPLAQEADVVLPLHAGAERSVAATKSFIASCAGLAAFAAAFAENSAMTSALCALPGVLGAVGDADAPVVDLLAGASSVYMAGRGPGFAIALEAALKAKETAALHAEAFSLAELMHGPARLAGRDLPVVAFVPSDQGRANALEALGRLREMGSPLARIGDLDDASIRVPSTGDGLVDPIAMIGAYYRLIEAVAAARGHDPDAPRNLSKVTETV